MVGREQEIKNLVTFVFFVAFVLFIFFIIRTCLSFLYFDCFYLFSGCFPVSDATITNQPLQLLCKNPIIFFRCLEKNNLFPQNNNLLKMGNREWIIIVEVTV